MSLAPKRARSEAGSRQPPNLPLRRWTNGGTRDRDEPPDRAPS